MHITNALVAAAILTRMATVAPYLSTRTGRSGYNQVPDDSKSVEVIHGKGPILPADIRKRTPSRRTDGRSSVYDAVKRAVPPRGSIHLPRGRSGYNRVAAENDTVLEKRTLPIWEKFEDYDYVDSEKRALGHDRNVVEDNDEVDIGLKERAVPGIAYEAAPPPKKREAEASRNRPKHALSDKRTPVLMARDPGWSTRAIERGAEAAMPKHQCAITADEATPVVENGAYSPPSPGRRGEDKREPKANLEPPVWQAWHLGLPNRLLDMSNLQNGLAEALYGSDTRLRKRKWRNWGKKREMKKSGESTP
ncbi:hypothetical protein AC578_9243 [Pseudocercospora eumusae]|uniref:Uncharacterized protein n=1 Tax=Pseudocercospora eumusae TaxID=321146 RepID=A0A139HNE7_9PEZI|nr:hypothetical protein AC578_9243 [Pseudocercospora eumusae]